MRIGTRLTLVLLLCVMPVLAAYTYWSVEQSNVYTNELKQSARAVSAGVAPAVDQEVIAKEWNRIGDAFRKLNAEGTLSALLKKDGTFGIRCRTFRLKWLQRRQVQLAQRSPRSSDRLRAREAGSANWFR